MQQAASVSAYGFDLSKVAPLALVMGDPERASLAASQLTSPELIWDIREYRAFTGSLNGKAITVCSHGVGAPGAALVFTDLFRAGVRTIIRAGTCGSLTSHIKNGMFVIATAAVREDGASDQLLPVEFPAVADHEVTNLLINSARDLSLADVHAGLVWSSALYYPSPMMDSNQQVWSRCGVLAGEMEMAVLFVLASIYNAKAGGILAVEADLEDSCPSEVTKDPQVVTLNRIKMIRVALNALTRHS